MPRKTVYNNNLTESWDSVSEENKKLVRDFIRYCKSNDKSQNTLHQYEEWLKVFFCWNKKENGDAFFVDLKKRDFVYYFGWCRDLGMSANRIASLKSVLSSLSAEIELLYEDVYPNFHSQLRGLQPIHIAPVRDKTVISGDEMAAMLRRLSDMGEHQVACYLALACASGARKAELLQMKPSFFDAGHEVFDGYMYCTPEIRTKGRGKRGKILKKYVIKDFFKPFFDAWMAERASSGIDCDSLFVTRKDGEYAPATVATANGFAERISKIFGIEYYAHSSRHFFCTLLKRMKLPDDVVTRVIGWSDSSMIKTYSDIPEEEILQEFFADFNARKEAKGE